MRVSPSDAPSRMSKRERGGEGLAGPAPGSGPSAHLAGGTFTRGGSNRFCGESIFHGGVVIRFLIGRGSGVRLQLDGTRLRRDPEDPLLDGEFGRLADFELGYGAHDGPLQLGESRVVRSEVLILLELFEGRAKNLNKTGRTRKHHLPWMRGRLPGVDREHGRNDPWVVWRGKEFWRE
jgi:hypothetical protein